MSIYYNSESCTFFLDGKNLTYAMKVSESGYLAHLYFGAPIAHDDLGSGRITGRDAIPTSMPGQDSPKYNYTHYLPELSFFGTGDFREPAIQIQNPLGDRLCDLLYRSHEILPKKPAITGMPSLDGGETLVIHLADLACGFGADLYYTVYDDASVITRRASFVNLSKEPKRLTRAYSFSLGLAGNDYDILSLYGGWSAERNLERTPLHHGVFSIDSKRGSSSSTLNPFMALLPEGTTEEHGNAYGVNLVYSSSFVLKAEGLPSGDTLLTGGVQDFDFCWKLDPGESFEAPEVVIAYSDKGIGGMSRAFHDAYRNHLIPKKAVRASRPIVINNWEATSFSFDLEKLKAIADGISGTGVDTFVLDDGWFSNHREDEYSGMGDWFPNDQKLGGSLKNIIDFVHARGMKFGIWFEPESCNEDSETYRTHPDYAIGHPDRPRCYSRHEFLMDLTRKEVREYIADAINGILRDYEIDYVKWDFNRSVTDMYSIGRDSERQAEFAHRYALGLYDLCDRIIGANPDVFFEGCASGGARFDPAMLFYFPQIWTSDNTDADARTRIQYGTSLAYPLSSMSCHVSSPHDGNPTATKTRADIAHLGATGYELDSSEFTDEDRATAKEHIIEYKKMEELVLLGDLYRLDDPFGSNFFSFLLVSKDKSRAHLTLYRKSYREPAETKRVRFCGLDPQKLYEIEGRETPLHGSTLMNRGLMLSLPAHDCATVTCHLTEIYQ